MCLGPLGRSRAATARYLLNAGSLRECVIPQGADRKKNAGGRVRVADRSS
jgi:hypothetical protein